MICMLDVKETIIAVQEYIANAGTSKSSFFQLQMLYTIYIAWDLIDLRTYVIVLAVINCWKTTKINVNQGQQLSRFSNNLDTIQLHFHHLSII